MDSFRESMDSFCIVITNPDSKKICFVSLLTNPTSQIRESRYASPILEDWIRGFDSQTDFKKIQPVFMNPMNPYKSLVHNHTLNKPKSIQILGFGFANPYCFQKIRFVDLFCPTVFKRFVSQIRFVDLFLKDSFRGFISLKQKSQITRFVLFRNDSYVIPASLEKITLSKISLLKISLLKITFLKIEKLF